MNGAPARWSRARLVAALTFGVVTISLLGALALHASAALFLLLSGADVRQARPLAFLDYWRLYADDAVLRRRLVVAGTGAAAVGFVVLPVALFAAMRRKRPLHGAARFANGAEIAAAGLLATPASGPAILVGRLGRRYLSLPGQLSVMLSAPTRSGKGVGIVIPNLLNWPDSVIALDIKGEIHAITAGFRAACGQAVYAFSPFDEQGRSHRWNPLSHVRTGPLHRIGDLLEIGQVLYPSDGGHTSSEAFFNDQARNLFLGLGLLLLESLDLPRTIGEMLRQSSGQGRSLREHLNDTLRGRREAGDPLSEECADALQRLLGNSDNTLSSIVATFNAPLTIFADAVVDAATSADDFDLQDPRRRRMSVYVRVPPHRLASARPLLNLFFSQVVSLNTRTRPEEDASLRYQCLLVNDEFTAMGRVGILTSAAAFLAGYNVRLLTVVQAMSQLDAVYGDKEARTFATNHGLQILYAPREQRDADEYSAMLGTFTERATSRGRSRALGMRSHTTVSRNESDQRRPLLLPQEFKELGSERLVLILENCKPVLADKIRYHREPVFRYRLRPAPAVPAMDVELHLARVQRRVSEAPEEIGPDDGFSLEQLAHDFSSVPPLAEDAGPEEIGGVVDAFFAQTRVAKAAAGGEIEQVICE